MRAWWTSLDTSDQLIWAGVALQAVGVALLPFALSAFGLVVFAGWVTFLGLRLARRTE